MHKRIVLGAFAALPLFAAAAAYAGTAYPNAPIHLVVGFPPGGSVDGIARALGEALSKRLDQSVIVENRPGAGTTIAASAVARAKPDGYTLYIGGAGVMGGDNALYKNLRYTADDFRPITQLSTSPMLIVSGAQSRFDSMSAVMRAAAKAPGTVSFSSSGSGAPTHLSGALFSQVAGIELLHVPFKGGAQSVTAVASGDVDIGFATPASAMSLVAAKKVRVLAVTSPSRFAGYPDAPTVKESALPGYAYSTWWGLFAPAGTPDAVVQKLFTAAVEALKSPAVHKQLATQGETPAPSASVAAFEAFARKEGALTADLIRNSNVRVD